MIPATQSAFDYSVLDANTAAIAQTTATSIRKLETVAKQSIAEIGRSLIGVKEVLGHGHFLAWVEAEFGWSERSARNFMQVAEAFKTANFADLEIDTSALYVLAAPSTPEPVRAQMIERAEAGERITHATAKAAVQAAKAPNVIEYAPVSSPAAQQRTAVQLTELARLTKTMPPVQLPPGILPLSEAEKAEIRKQPKSPADARTIASMIERLADFIKSSGTIAPEVRLGASEIGITDEKLLFVVQFFFEMDEEIHSA